MFWHVLSPIPCSINVQKTRVREDDLGGCRDGPRRIHRTRRCLALHPSLPLPRPKMKESELKYPRPEFLFMMLLQGV